jgi:hypothetical protein
MQNLYTRIIAVAGAVLAISFTSTVACAAAQKTFATTDDAAAALVAAARSGDRAALEEMFGPDSHDLFFSGDDVADLGRLKRFSEWADESTELVDKDDGSVEIVVGEEEWPLPIPLVKADHGWRFDTAAGKEEIINRRIGEAELSAIDVCRALIVALTVYASKDRDGDGVKEYAQKILSDDGKENGLYWDAAQHGGDPSPIGPLVATATSQGYKREAGKPTPYHGYYFRILTKQGEHAPGGKKDYVVDGNMTGGFAVIASPAEYGVSGIMSFLINKNGIMFQKDLGEDTEKIAAAIDSYDPDDSWDVEKD